MSLVFSYLFYSFCSVSYFAKYLRNVNMQKLEAYSEVATQKILILILINSWTFTLYDSFLFYSSRSMKRHSIMIHETDSCIDLLGKNTLICLDMRSNNFNLHIILLNFREPVQFCLIWNQKNSQSFSSATFMIICKFVLCSLNQLTLYCCWSTSCLFYLSHLILVYFT